MKDTAENKTFVLGKYIELLSHQTKYSLVQQRCPESKSDLCVEPNCSLLLLAVPHFEYEARERTEGR